jgi:hypothetical protein
MDECFGASPFRVGRGELGGGAEGGGGGGCPTDTIVESKWANRCCRHCAFRSTVGERRMKMTRNNNELLNNIQHLSNKVHPRTFYKHPWVNEPSSSLQKWIVHVSSLRVRWGGGVDFFGSPRAKRYPSKYKKTCMHNKQRKKNNYSHPCRACPVRCCRTRTDSN